MGRRSVKERERERQGWRVKERNWWRHEICRTERGEKIRAGRWRVREKGKGI